MLLLRRFAPRRWVPKVSESAWKEGSRSYLPNSDALLAPLFAGGNPAAHRRHARYSLDRAAVHLKRAASVEGRLAAWPGPAPEPLQTPLFDGDNLQEMLLCFNLVDRKAQGFGTIQLSWHLCTSWTGAMIKVP